MKSVKLITFAEPEDIRPIHTIARAEARTLSIFRESRENSRSKSPAALPGSTPDSSPATR